MAQSSPPSSRPFFYRGSTPISFVQFLPPLSFSFLFFYFYKIPPRRVNDASSMHARCIPGIIDFRSSIIIVKQRCEQIRLASSLSLSLYYDYQISSEFPVLVLFFLLFTRCSLLLRNGGGRIVSVYLSKRYWQRTDSRKTKDSVEGQ